MCWWWGGVTIGADALENGILTENCQVKIGQELLSTFGQHEQDPQIDGFWRAMLSAGSASPEAVQVSAGSASPEPVQAPPTEPAQASAPRPFESWAWACML